MGGRVRACHEGPLLRDCDPDHPRSQARRHSSGLDADPPRQRSTRWLAGPASRKKNSLCATMITVDWASPDSETQVARKESRSTTVNHHDWTQTLLARDELDVWPGLRPQGRAFPRQKTSSPQECQRTQTSVRQGRRAPAPRSVTGRACWRMPGLKNTVACQSSCWCPPVLGLVARQFLGWCPQVYGLATLRNVPVRLFSRVGILRCRVAHSTVVCVATATRLE